MTRASLVLPVMVSCLAFGQSSGTRPRFVGADVHSASSPAELNPRPIPIHDDRYEVKGATMLDLIAAAWGWDSWKIMGGPNWLELDRFDITAKLPAGLSLDKRMLQALLEDRFKLVVREDTRPLPGYVLTVDKRPALKKTAGGKSGCVPYVSATPTRMDMTANENGPNPVRYTMGPASTVTYNCRNITMDAFAKGLQAMIGANLAPGPVADGTGLKGAWDFELHWTHQYVHLDRLPQGHTTISDALDQQLGLKLEERPVPAPALVVVSVNRTPTANAPDLARVLPPIQEPKQFDVASVKPTDPQRSRTNMRIEPARLTLERYPMRYLLNVAFPGERFANLPDWTEMEAFDIVAKTPPGVAALNRTNLAAAMQALLRDRFGLKYHTEQRPGPAYRIDAAKPRMKKADPARRFVHA
ncbi:MAG TPA: TIGR03435 family protein [Bryobacteraceae bacterium]